MQCTNLYHVVILKMNARLVLHCTYSMVDVAMQRSGLHQHYAVLLQYLRCFCFTFSERMSVCGTMKIPPAPNDWNLAVFCVLLLLPTWTALYTRVAKSWRKKSLQGFLNRNWILKDKVTKAIETKIPPLVGWCTAGSSKSGAWF